MEEPEVWLPESDNPLSPKANLSLEAQKSGFSHWEHMSPWPCEDVSRHFSPGRSAVRYSISDGRRSSTRKGRLFGRATLPLPCADTIDHRSRKLAPCRSPMAAIRCKDGYSSCTHRTRRSITVNDDTPSPDWCPSLAPPTDQASLWLQTALVRLDVDATA